MSTDVSIILLSHCPVRPDDGGGTVTVEPGACVGFVDVPIELHSCHAIWSLCRHMHNNLFMYCVKED